MAGLTNAPPRRGLVLPVVAGLLAVSYPLFHFFGAAAALVAAAALAQQERTRAALAVATVAVTVSLCCFLLLRV